MLFPYIKWIHVLSAILAVGANATYGFWMARASRKPELLPFVLHTIKFIDDWLANPLYALLLLTGLTMAFMLPIPLNTPCIMSALILYGIALILGFVVFVPMFRRQIELLEEEGFESASYQAIARRARAFGLIVGVIVL